MKLKFWENDNREDSSTDANVEHLAKHIERLEEELDSISTKGVTSSVNTTAGSIPSYADAAFLQSLYLSEGWVYIAVHAVAKQIAQLPLITEKKFLHEETVVMPNGNEVVRNKYVWMREDIPQYFDLLSEPNPDFSMSELMKMLTVDILTTGQAFIFKNITAEVSENPRDRMRGALGRNANFTLHRINPAVMSVVRNRDTGFVEGYNMTSEEETYYFKESEVVWLKSANPADPDAGLSPLMPILQKISLERFKDDHMIRFYKQGARLGGVIKTTKNLTKDQVNRLERTFEANYTGKKNFHRTLILPNGMDYKTIESEPTGSSLKQMQDSNKEQILAAFGVPPIKVGLLDSGTYDNAEVQNATFYKDTISPLYKLIADKINSKNIILDMSDHRIAFDISDVPELQSDSAEKGDIARGMIATGLSINEVRERVWNLGAVENGHIVPALHKLVVAEAYSGASPNDTPNPNGPENDPTDNPNQVNGEDGVIGGQNRTEDVNQDVNINNEGKALSDAANVQNDTEALSNVVDTNLTFSQRVEELMLVAISQGIEPKIAVRTAIEQAISEGFSPSNIESSPEEEKKNSIYLEKFGEEKLKEFQAATTGIGLEGLINNRQDVYKKVYTEQIEWINNWLKSSSSTKSLKSDTPANELPTFNPVVDTQSFVFKRMVFELAWLHIVEGESPIGDLWGSLTPEYGILLDDPEVKSLAIEGAQEINTMMDLSTIDILSQNSEALEIGFNSAYPSVEMNFPTTNAQNFRSSSLAAQIKNINHTTLGKVRSVLDKAIQTEMDIDSVVDSLDQSVETFAVGRSKVIARTEVLTDVSVGHEVKRQQIAESLPQVADKMKKMWVTARDNKVRDEHDHMDGEVVGKDDNFSNGLKFPRDPNGPAHEVVNCRCAVIDFIEDDRESIDNIFGNKNQLDLFDGLFR